ncbi:cytochrome P450 [Ophiobolus disseminans]|uniref:Cytochrome P450 n=1 Tax=Ophiobolus disseminans TaxID=1469910 RepID=A0A6A6ZQX3_9PLEO|nr:cytochrome P450 [Ophiobolus disseminans]
MATYLMREHDTPGIYFVDARPISALSLFITDPDIAQRVSESTLAKPPVLGAVLEPIAGKLNMLSTANYALWKKWRSIFNPGFSIQQIVSQVPVMVGCGQAYVKILDEHVSANRVFRLEEEATKVTIDVIGKVICDHDFNALSSNSDFLKTMRTAFSWMPDQTSINPFHLLNPVRPFMARFCKWKMDKYVGTMLDERFAVRDATLPKKSRKKTGIDLALEEYFKEKGQDIDAQEATMDAEFRKAAIDNLLILLFAGHDTTAATLCYCYHILQKHPAELTKVRQEMDSVFGAGLSAGEQLKQNPYLVNQLEYTLAVIKEILRLWPAASGARIGRKGFFIKHPTTGDMIDTDGIMIWNVSMAMQRDQRIWGDDADIFKPERFLPANADKLPPNAWRPFEKGPRNCIGQELSLIEMKVMLAMTLREFEFKAAYDELEPLMGDGSLWTTDSSYQKGPQEVFGERMYQVLFGAAKPSEAQNATVDLKWYAPKKSWINDLGQVMNSTGTNGFLFNSSQLPAGIPYGTYNWCNMPHVRPQEYPKVAEEFELIYVEVIHRHHKRTPYASNTFPKESYGWDCDDQGLFHYGQPLNPSGYTSASTYWNVSTSDINPFAQAGFRGSCQFPQITRGGLDDSWQHGKDLYAVYHDLLSFLPSNLTEKVSYRVTNNQITSQVAGMLIGGMYDPQTAVSLHIQPPNIDSLEPQYPCPKASSLYSSYGVGSTAPNWTAHLTAAKPLFAALDAVSGIPSTSTEWHKSLDHYYDNLSARQCHAKPLPCSINDSTACITQDQADTVYRLGQYEYSFIHRDSPQSLNVAVASYGVWLAELASHIRAAAAGTSHIIYRHNVAHDGSIARLLSVLQIEEMVWVGMGSEVVFEIYRRKGSAGGRYVRILWGGRVLRSSSPVLGQVDMLDLDVFLGYVEGLVGRGAERVVEMCKA